MLCDYSCEYSSICENKKERELHEQKKKEGVRCEKNEKMKRKSFAPKKIHTRNFDPNF